MATWVPWGQLLCPFCFERFRLAEAWFRCRNPNLGECPEEVDLVYSAHTGVPNRYMKKAFPSPPSKSFRCHVHEAKCPGANCSKPTTQRLCPHCHSKLPAEIEYIDSKILAVIGGTSSGKSHYIATMVNQLRKTIGPNLKIQVTRVGETTTQNYNTYYHDPVYLQKTVLPQTQSAQVNPVVREPLIYRLEFPRRGLSIPAVNLVLFDAAGEDVQDENTLALYNKYLLHAAGIIFLINPLQIRSICEQLGVPPDSGETAQDTLDRVVELFRVERRMRPGKKIKIPTVFLVTKSDTLGSIVDDKCRFLQDVPHVGQYDLSDFEMINEEIKSYLSTWGEDGLISGAEQFQPRGFFAVSALGSNPDKKTLRIPRIDPIRCGDPVLWLLTQLGYLKEYRSVK